MKSEAASKLLSDGLAKSGAKSPSKMTYLRDFTSIITPASIRI